MNSDFSNLSQDERDLRLTMLMLGELSAAEAEEVRRGIAADPGLASDYEQRRQTVELVRETAALDRKVSADGAALKLDEARRQRLLEAFRTRARHAATPRRPKNLWFVPMSAAAVLVGLLVALALLPLLSKAKARAQRVYSVAAVTGPPAALNKSEFLDRSGASDGRNPETRFGNAAGVPVAAPPPPPPNFEIALPKAVVADNRVQLSGSVADARPGRTLGEQLAERPIDESSRAGRRIPSGRRSQPADSSATVSADPSSDGAVVTEAITVNPKPVFGTPPLVAKPVPEINHSFAAGASDSRRPELELSDSLTTPAAGAYFNGETKPSVALHSDIASHTVDASPNVHVTGGFGGLPATAPAAEQPPSGTGVNVYSVNAAGFVNLTPPAAAKKNADPVNLNGDRFATVNNGAIAMPDTGSDFGSGPNAWQNVALNDADHDATSVGAGRESGERKLSRRGELVAGGEGQFQGGQTKAESASLSLLTREQTSSPSLDQRGASIQGGSQSALQANGSVGGSVGPVTANNWSMATDFAVTATNGLIAADGLEPSIRGKWRVADGEGFGEVPQLGYVPSLGQRFENAQTQSGGRHDNRPINGPEVSGVTSGVASTGAGTVRGFFDDKPNPSPATRLEEAGDANGLAVVQLPEQADEPQLKRERIPARPLREDEVAEGLGTKPVEALAGIDAGWLPVLTDAEKRLPHRTMQAESKSGAVSFEEKRLANPKANVREEAEISQVLDSYAELAGKQLLKSPQIQIKRAISVVDQTKLSKEQRISAIESALSSNEIALVETGEKFIKVVPQAIVPQEAGSKTSLSQVVESARTEPRQATKRSIPAPVPQPEVLARDNAFSTFSLNVSDVSFKLAAASLEKGAMPDAAGIRSEEFINAFDYRDPMPSVGAPLAFTWERARYPFAHNRDVVRFSIKTAAQGREAGKPLNIVVLLDNSGSMERADRVRIIQESLRTLAAQLKPQDKLSVVTFARTASLRVDGVSGTNAVEGAKEVGTLTPEGGTNLEDALDLAYRTALRHYAATAVNRVVLLTDGAANLGNVEPKTLKAKVESFRQQGIALDCFGIGWEGFNDDLLEQLSRNGDGRYGFVNAPEEAASEFVGQLAGALHVAASDVKMQVEFNPKRVTAWRQIGYAKHQLTKQQFRDNAVDAAEIGAAESGNALYIIETDPNGEGPVATVRARFRIPQTSDYREHEWVVPFGSSVELERSSPALRLAATASAFSEWLASSPFAGEVTTDHLLQLLSGVPETYGVDPRPKRLEWMIRQAKSISGK